MNFSRHITPGSALDVYRRLLGYSAKHIKHFVAAFAGMALYSASDAGFAILIKPLFDEGLIEQGGAIGVWLSFAIVGVLFVRGVGAFVAGSSLAYIAQHITKELRSKLFHHMLHLKISYYDEHPPGKLISRMTFNVGRASAAVSKALTVLIQDSLTVLAVLAWMFYLSWILTSILLLATPVLIIILKVVNRKFRIASKRLQQSMASLTGDVEQMVRGIHVIKVFGNNNYEYAEFTRNNEAVRRHELKFARARAMITPIVIFVIGIVLGWIIYLLTLEGVIQRISVGSIASFFVSVVILMRPVRNLVNINSVLQQGVVAAQSVFDVLDIEPEHDTGGAVGKRFSGRISFVGVSHRYAAADRSSLEDVTLEVPAGEMLALVGHSGAGKTTLIHLIPRFYEPSAGRIELDGKDIRTIRLAELRDQISYVGQNTMLFHDSLKNNVTYGRRATDAEVREAMRRAHVLEFADKLPQGIDTPIGADGVQLSGGQRQRVAIARALLKASPVMIFDEATSFLDGESEAVIKQTLMEIAGSCTMIVIAHRLSTVERADRIAVMKGGRIVEQGRHQELLAQAGHYSELYRAGQTKGLLE